MLRTRRWFIGVLVCTSILAAGLGPLWSPSSTLARDIGAGRTEAEIDGERIEVYTFRPSGCAAPSLLLVFHGNGRTAKSYRDSASGFAERSCFVVFAPLFDRDRFPNWAYHRGGLVEDGELLPEEEWTVRDVAALVEWALDQEGRPEAPVFLFGHSAGAQFLSRVVAYSPLPDSVERVILANPSTYVLPTAEEDAPYGFGRLEAETPGMQQAYLAAPVTVFLGTADTGEEDLTMTAAAQRQGENRLERGQYVFGLARRFAEEKGWAFNWQLVHAEGVGHSARGMLGAAAMLEAIGLAPVH